VKNVVCDLTTPRPESSLKITEIIPGKCRCGCSCPTVDRPSNSIQGFGNVSINIHVTLDTE